MKFIFDIWCHQTVSCVSMLIWCNYSFDVTTNMKKWRPFWIFKFKNYFHIWFSTKLFLMWVCSFNGITWRNGGNFYMETVSSPNGSICDSAHFMLLQFPCKFNNLKKLYWDCVFKNIFCMGVHTFNVITFIHFHNEKEIRKWEKYSKFRSWWASRSFHVF